MRERPNWLGALSVALTRPPGMPERRTGEDPWSTTAAHTRPRRIARERLVRLRERHVLEAAGFELTDVAEPVRVTPPRFERQPAEAPAATPRP